MKNFLFTQVAVISAFLVGTSTSIGSFVVDLISGAFNGFNWLVRAIAVRLMMLIDVDRYSYTSRVIEQRGDLTELNVLKSITSVKESALRDKVWTMSHTAAMNQLGNALHTQCGWEPARIHYYMRGVIEQIPGLVYYGGDDFEGETETA